MQPYRTLYTSNQQGWITRRKQFATRGHFDGGYEATGEHDEIICSAVCAGCR